LKEKQDSSELTLVWPSQQECNLEEIIKLAEEGYNDLERIW
jgi:hypothetical protein